MKKIFIIMLLSIFLGVTVNVRAHSFLLNIEYDDCSMVSNQNEEDEKWYFLYYPEADEGNISKEYEHIDEEVTTIKYYIYDSAANDSEYTWTTDLSESQANYIKQSYINSMLKWNNVYYYSYDENGSKVSNKVINIIEGTKNNHDISIYPLQYYYTNNNNSDDDYTYFAATGMIDSGSSENTGNENASHKHHNKWQMWVNITWFYSHDIINGKTKEYNSPIVTEECASMIRERTGMHEMGHVLGLNDIDRIESLYEGTNDHHLELLMGYGNNYARSRNATYKDIAGVSITRGFHTDNDHIWMLRTNTNGTKDVICSLCNGVRYNINTTINNQGKTCYENKEVNIYKSCTHYGGSNYNMLHVATNGVQDFYKCQYCRHIETVEVHDEITLPDPTSLQTTDTLIKGETRYIILNVTTSNMYQFNLTANSSIEYNIFDEDFNEVSYYTGINTKTFQLSGGESYYLRMRFVSPDASGEITTIINEHTHSDIYTWLDYTNHQKTCSCGRSSIEGHAIRNEDYISGNMNATCIICGGIANIGFIEIQNNIVMISDNGSYVLSNGIVVLVDSDIESYLNNTLVFRNPNEDIM